MLTEMHVPFRREVTVKFEGGPRKYARVDFIWPTQYGATIFEVDEFAHRSPRYDVAYECQRMKLVYQEMLTRGCERVHFIRYNSHPTRGKRKPTREERVDQIGEALAHIPAAPLVITYLFYHMKDGLPEIVLLPEYTLREHVRAQEL